MRINGSFVHPLMVHIWQEVFIAYQKCRGCRFGSMVSCILYVFFLLLEQLPDSTVATHFSSTLYTVGRP